MNAPFTSCPGCAGQHPELGELYSHDGELWHVRCLIPHLVRLARTEHHAHECAQAALVEAQAELARETSRLRVAEAITDLARRDREHLRNVCARLDFEVCQILGRALGYPLADPEIGGDGQTVCVGDHEARSLAAEAAERIQKAEQPCYCCRLGCKSGCGCRPFTDERTECIVYNCHVEIAEDCSAGYCASHCDMQMDWAKLGEGHVCARHHAEDRPTFTCPKCGASHSRGPVNGADVYRCLRCGWAGRQDCPTATETAEDAPPAIFTERGFVQGAEPRP